MAMKAVELGKNGNYFEAHQAAKENGGTLISHIQLVKLQADKILPTTVFARELLISTPFGEVFEEDQPIIDRTRKLIFSAEDMRKVHASRKIFGRTNVGILVDPLCFENTELPGEGTFQLIRAAHTSWTFPIVRDGETGWLNPDTGLPLRTSETILKATMQNEKAILTGGTGGIRFILHGGLTGQGKPSEYTAIAFNTNQDLTHQHPIVIAKEV